MFHKRKMLFHAKEYAKACKTEGKRKKKKE